MKSAHPEMGGRQWTTCGVHLADRPQAGRDRFHLGWCPILANAANELGIPRLDHANV